MESDGVPGWGLNTGYGELGAPPRGVMLDHLLHLGRNNDEDCCMQGGADSLIVVASWEEIM
jgi:hypothetical protein